MPTAAEAGFDVRIPATVCVAARADADVRSRMRAPMRLMLVLVAG